MLRESNTPKFTHCSELMDPGNYHRELQEESNKEVLKRRHTAIVGLVSQGWSKEDAARLSGFTLTQVEEILATHKPYMKNKPKAPTNMLWVKQKRERYRKATPDPLQSTITPQPTQPPTQHPISQPGLNGNDYGVFPTPTPTHRRGPEEGPTLQDAHVDYCEVCGAGQILVYYHRRLDMFICISCTPTHSGE